MPVPRASCMLHDVGLLSHTNGIARVAWTIVVNLPVVFWTWLNTTLIGDGAGPLQLMVPATVAIPVFGLTATFGFTVSDTGRKASNSNTNAYALLASVMRRALVRAEPALNSERR